MSDANSKLDLATLLGVPNENLDEENPEPGDKEPEAAPTPDADAEPKPADADPDAEPEGDDEPDEPSEIDVVKNQIKELRQLLRDVTAEKDSLQSKYAALEKQLKEGGHLPEENPERDKIEAQHAKLQERLEVMLETMRGSDKFGDVDEIVTQGRAGDIMDMMAKELSEREGISIKEARTAVEGAVWYRQANPYRFLYNAIKKFHPDFAEKQPSSMEPKPKKGAPSIPGSGGQNGKGAGEGTWTSAKIDKLSESGDVNALNSVPKDIYEKYLAGELA